jgi:glycosyltransferase involved in cell wall biosynthesis
MRGGRVAIHLISTGGVYGAERVLLEIAGYIHAQGWQCHVVALEGQGAGDLVNFAVSAGLTGEAFKLGARMAILPMAIRLRQLLREHPRAIVHSHNYKPDMLLSMLGAPRRLACVATCHSSYRETRKLRFLATLDKRALRSFDRVVAVSAEIHDELLVSGIRREQLALIHNGIAAPQPEAHSGTTVRAEFDVPAGAKLIVQIGRLVRLKRSDLLFNAVSRLPQALDAHILLVGEGDQRQALAALAIQKGLESRVHFCGYRNDTARILAAADLMVLTSDYEGLPMVIIEAMAMRCPIVTTRVGAIPDVLNDGEDAWIVPINDVEALIVAIGAALGSPRIARERAANAHLKYLARHSREAVGARYLEIYESVWARRAWD